jgi:hypothetical protein
MVLHSGHAPTAAKPRNEYPQVRHRYSSVWCTGRVAGAAGFAKVTTVVAVVSGMAPSALVGSVEAPGRGGGDMLSDWELTSGKGYEGLPLSVRGIEVVSEIGSGVSRTPATSRRSFPATLSGGCHSDNFWSQGPPRRDEINAIGP